jgi:hypothetical protein
LLFALVALPVPLAAADLPGIKVGRSNPVPECVTPGRLMAYLKSRNGELDPRYAGIATEYMRIGEQLGLRWDYAFYQMILETGSLSYRRGNHAGDVRPSQNNFAGLGATGRGEHGESFHDISAGVRAHLEHLLLYAGDRIDNPVAERTRKVQEWGVLTEWHRGFTRPITFADLAAKWAPGTNSYRRMIEGIAESFQEFCRRPDPRPELVEEARGTREKRLADAKPAETKPDRTPGGELAQRAIEVGKATNDDQRSGLGGQPPSDPAATAQSGSVPFRVLNSPSAETFKEAAHVVAGPRTDADGAAVRTGAPESMAQDASRKASGLATGSTAKATASAGRAEKPASTGDRTFQTASALGGAAKAAAAPPPSSGQKCRVWTASYGGQKALIIKSQVDKVVNYTVLDVNEGAESREAEAFISAYAKNGAVAGQFGSQAQALEKAFELCPEG